MRRPFIEAVCNEKQQKEFENTWEFLCSKMGWFNDPYSEHGVRYLIVLGENNNREIIGTIEFIPYHPNNPHSTVEGKTEISFSLLPEFKNYYKRIWEIDKLCIKQEYQRKGYFYLFLYVFYYHARQYSPRYYIALIEKKFFRMLKISFGLHVDKVGEELIGPGTSLVPVKFHIESIISNKKVIKGLLSNNKKPPLKKQSLIYQYFKQYFKLKLY
ncbi:GNAT family N-acyltransferase [Metabacillus indicus]|uniref:GNAT family N-acyltransferase n=1 Tax=Metabacillus indicus TaxID=246786 RepID=UPI003983F7C1